MWDHSNRTVDSCVKKATYGGGRRIDSCRLFFSSSMDQLHVTTPPAHQKPPFPVPNSACHPCYATALCCRVQAAFRVWMHTQQQLLITCRHGPCRLLLGLLPPIFQGVTESQFVEPHHCVSLPRRTIKLQTCSTALITARTYPSLLPYCMVSGFRVKTPKTPPWGLVDCA